MDIFTRHPHGALADSRQGEFVTDHISGKAEREKGGKTPISGSTTGGLTASTEPKRPPFQMR